MRGSHYDVQGLEVAFPKRPHKHALPCEQTLQSSNTRRSLHHCPVIGSGYILPPEAPSFPCIPKYLSLPRTVAGCNVRPGWSKDCPMNVTVLTLNCWGLWLLSRDRAERLRLIGEQLLKDDLDVALLQEVFVGSDAAMLAAAAAQGALKHSQYFPSGYLGGELLILSRWPIQYIRYHAYSASGSPVRVWEGDFYAAKGVGLACLGSPAGPLHVYTTHICANYAHSYEPAPEPKAASGSGSGLVATDGNAPVRALQFLELVQFITAHSAQDNAGIIVGGDFNCRPVDFEVALFHAALPALRDAWGTLHPHDPGNTSNTFLYDQHVTLHKDPPARIDYLWSSLEPVQAALAMRDKVKGRYLSDHLAVRAVFRCNGSSSGGGAAQAGMRLPGDLELAKTMAADATLFQTAHRLLMTGMHDYEVATRALSWSAALLWAPLLAATIALSFWVAAAEGSVAGTVWMWAIFLLAALVPAVLIPLQLALSVGLWSQACAMRVLAESVQRALQHAPVEAAAAHALSQAAGQALLPAAS